MRTASSCLRSDRDAGVSAAAVSALAVLDSLATPRAPPILIPSREVVSTSSVGFGGTVSAGGLLERMDGSRAEAGRKEKMEEEKRSRKKKAREDRPKKKKAKVESNESTRVDPPAVGGPTIEKPVTKKPSDATEEQEAISSNERPGDVTASTSSPVAEVTETAAEENHAPQPMEVTELPVAGGPGANESEAADHETKENDAPGADEAKPHGTDDDDGESDGGSLGDFPDIVDGDPDEEDRV